MKTTMLLVFLGVTFYCNAQTPKHIIFKKDNKENELILSIKEDTIIIPADTKYKFIKIGGNLYKIASPSLQLVPNEPTFIEPIVGAENLPIYPKSKLLNLTPADTLVYGNIYNGDEKDSVWHSTKSDTTFGMIKYNIKKGTVESRGMIVKETEYEHHKIPINITGDGEPFVDFVLNEESSAYIETQRGYKEIFDKFTFTPNKIKIK